MTAIRHKKPRARHSTPSGGWDATCLRRHARKQPLAARQLQMQTPEELAGGRLRYQAPWLWVQVE